MFRLTPDSSFILPGFSLGSQSTCKLGNRFNGFAPSSSFFRTPLKTVKLPQAKAWENEK